MVAASCEVKSYLTNRGVSVDAASASPPTRARAHRVLVFGRKFYLEDTLKVNGSKGLADDYRNARMR